LKVYNFFLHYLYELSMPHVSFMAITR